MGLEGLEKSLPIDSSTMNSKATEMFAVFGGIYAFTYAVGGNYDYRLIFLAPTLPFVLQLGRSQHRMWAVLYIAMVALAENAMAFEDYGGTLAGHAATFLLFLMVLAMLTKAHCWVPRKLHDGFFDPCWPLASRG